MDRKKIIYCARCGRVLTNYRIVFGRKVCRDDRECYISKDVVESWNGKDSKSEANRTKHLPDDVRRVR